MSGAHGPGGNGCGKENGRNGRSLKQWWPFLGPLVGLIGGLLINLVNNERQTAKDVSFQEGLEIGRAQGAAAARQDWLDQGGHVHPDKPAYRDPPAGDPQGAGPGEGGQR